MQNFTQHPAAALTRRHFFADCQIGLGSIALASLLGRDAAGAGSLVIDDRQPLLPRQPHFAARAMNVIFLHMAGSPPHLDLFDYKPELVRRTDEPCPDQFYEGKQFAFTSSRPTLLGTPHKFSQRGPSGAWFSDAVPHLAGVADELCFV